MWDLIIIGGGAGGVAAAVRASQFSSKVLVVEGVELGGLCMNKGCIPTKTLLQSAFFYNAINHCEEFGIIVEKASLDLKKLAQKKDNLINYLRMGTNFLLKSKGIEVVRGKAAFIDPKNIAVDEKTLEAKAFIIATGSKWEPPPIRGIDHEGVISSDEAMAMVDPPKSITIIGGGPLEVEFALYFATIGSKVTLIEEASRLLPSEDREVGSRITAALKEKGVVVSRRSTVEAVERKKEGLFVEVSSKKEGSGSFQCDFVLTMRRVPNFDGLQLDKAGVRTDQKGIPVDGELRTNKAHIYAIGDVTGEPMYSHRAAAQGIAAVENLHGLQKRINEQAIPRAFYTKPEIGAVGLTEREAKEKGLSVQVGLIPYSMNSRAMIELETDGMIKVISESRHGEILGVHIVGPYATELIGQAALAIQMEATVDELSEAVFPHPSLSESLPEAAREALGRAIYMPSR
jgi:dihydrolipoamide dehydrogenase